MTTESIVILFVIIILFLGISCYAQITERENGSWSGWKKISAMDAKKGLIAGMVFVLSLVGIMAYVLFPEAGSVLKTIRILSVFLLFACAAEAVEILISIRRNKKEVDRISEEESSEIERSTEIASVSTEVKKEGFGRREILMLAGIMLGYGLLTFIGLGSRSMPQTAMEIIPDEEGSHEIILDLGEEKELYCIYMHLGHMLDRIIAVSYYDEEEAEWVPLEEEAELGANYNWNQVVIDKKLRYLGIVSRNGKAVFHELVLIDENGEKMLPVNSEEYQLLFDEQELFPDEMSYYDCTMFDEVYYAGSAYEFLNGMEMFETTHPPMGKILIAIGEWLFGVNPFGWRFVCAVFGTLMLPLMCWFLYRIFKNSQIALIGTALLGLDFMHYTLSRIATLDTIIAFFILAMFAFMWRILERAQKELDQERKTPSAGLLGLMVVCAWMTGMGVATKWTGFYAMAGIALCFLWFVISRAYRLKKQGKRPVYCIKMLGEGIAVFGILPLGIYVFSFLPQMLASGAKNIWKVMWDNSLFMLKFHSNIVFDHPYESPWYTWAWMRTPLVDSVDIVGSDQQSMLSMVVTMGNPIIWWCGLAACFYMMYRTFFKKDKKAGYLVFAYLSMYIPWFFVKRTVFIYQYYGSSLFLISMLAYALYLLGEKKRKAVPVFLEIALFAFILFYPVISGYPVSNYHLVIYLEWLQSWKFAWI